GWGGEEGRISKSRGVRVMDEAGEDDGAVTRGTQRFSCATSVLTILARKRRLEQHGLPLTWPSFLDDFQEHWPTDTAGCPTFRGFRNVGYSFHSPRQPPTRLA